MVVVAFVFPIGRTNLDDLPDETENEMLGSVVQVDRSDVNDGTSDALGRADDEGVVFILLPLLLFHIKCGC